MPLHSAEAIHLQSKHAQPRRFRMSRFGISREK